MKKDGVVGMMRIRKHQINNTLQIHNLLRGETVKTTETLKILKVSVVSHKYLATDQWN